MEEPTTPPPTRRSTSTPPALLPRRRELLEDFELDMMQNTTQEPEQEPDYQFRSSDTIPIIDIYEDWFQFYDGIPEPFDFHNENVDLLLHTIETYTSEFNNTLNSDDDPDSTK